MAKNLSESSRYQSRYGGGWVAPQQILAEVMCERIAGKEKTSLPAKFWDVPRWQKHFLMQLRLALKLLDKYHPSVISRGIRSNDGRRAFSFGAPFLRDIFDREQLKYDTEITSLSSSPAPVVSDEPAVESATRPCFAPRRNLKSRLEELDRD